MTGAGPYWGNSNLPLSKSTDERWSQMAGTITMTGETYDAMIRERDELRAENERLREQVAYLQKYVRHRPDGQRQPGELNGQHKLTVTDVRQIRSMLVDGVQQKVIAQHFGVHPRTILDIKTGRHWSTVD